MSLFENLGSAQTARQNPLTPDLMRREIGAISANPAAYLAQRGFNIPANLTDARQITRHLLSTGQVGGARLQQVMQLLGRK